MTREVYCPKCNQTFEEGSRRFCPTDGARLISESAEAATGHSTFSSIFGKSEPAQQQPKPTSEPVFTLDLDEDKHALSVRREFMSNITVVLVERYPAMRKFYDHVVRSDQHELVLRKKSVTAAK